VPLVHDAAERSEVCFLDSDISSNRGKIQLSAGAPRVLGEDDERILLAARRIIESAPPLPVQTGVNRGLCSRARWGLRTDGGTRSWAIPCTIAARLMTKAPVGQVYASGEVLRRKKTTFERRALDPLRVKGKARPREAWAVGPVTRAVSPGIQRQNLPLVGPPARARSAAFSDCELGPRYRPR
jgi:hypothetical protein